MCLCFCSKLRPVLIYLSEKSFCDCHLQYKWIKSSPPQDPSKAKPKKKRTKTLQSSFGKKTIIKVDKTD